MSDLLRSQSSMQSSSIQSLSGRVVSKCQLLGCNMVLMKTSLGLCLQWELTGDHCMKNKEHMEAVIVTEIQTGVRMYPVKMDSLMEKAVFGKIMSSGGSKGTETEPTALLVVCDTGEVMAAHSKLPGFLVILCHIAQPVIWTGILEVSGTSAVVVVGKAAVLNIGKSSSSVMHTSTEFCGKYGKSSLFWHTKTLTTVAVTCFGQNDTLVFSDGFVCRLCHITFVSENKVELKCCKLPVNGVIEITCESVDHVEMLTCDGRKYTCSWKVLTAGNKSDTSKLNSRLTDKEVPHTMEGIMTGIQRCSELMNIEGKNIHTLDMYIKQLSIAHRLLTEPQSCIFSTSVRVEQSIAQRNSYFAVIQFSKTGTNIDLDGRWWRLCIVIPGADRKHFVCAKLDGECFKTDICMSVALPRLNLSNTLDSITIESYLVLDHFSSYRPVCRIFACQTKVDIFHFLACQRNLSTFDISSPNSVKLSHALLQGKESINFKSSMNRSPAPYCKVFSSFITHDKISSLFGTLLNFVSPSYPRNKTSEVPTHQVSLWYHDDRIDLHCSMIGDRIHLTLEGHNPFVVLSLKASLERRVKELGLPSLPVTLTPAVLRQAHLTHRILNFEANVATTPVAISHLYHSVTYLMSLLPFS